MSSTIGNWNQLLVNRVVFITGAGGQIAKDIAKTCYVQGARLVLGDLQVSFMDNLINELTTNENEIKDRIITAKLDVTDETTIQEVVKAAVDKWGTIHVLINV